MPTELVAVIEVCCSNMTGADTTTTAAIQVWMAVWLKLSYVVK